MTIVIPNIKIPNNCKDSRGELSIVLKINALNNMIHVQIVIELLARCY